MLCSLKKDSLLVCWSFLFLSIFLEVVGTTILKYSQLHWTFSGVPITIGLMCLSYITLSRALFRLPVGVAYAVWEGIGLAVIVVMSVLFLGEQLTLPRVIGLGLVFAGSVLIHKGTEARPLRSGTEKPVQAGVHAERR